MINTYEMASKPNLSILDISLNSGGAEKVISLLLKELVNDYNVTLVLFYNEIHFPIPQQVNTVILCEGGPNRPFYSKLIDVLRFIVQYNRLLKKENIDFAISFLAFPNLVNCIASIANPKVKTYISERGYPSYNTSSKLSHYISKIFYPLLYNRCDKLFSNSVYINKDLTENFGIKIPMEVIYNPIELPDNTINHTTLAAKKEVLRIINVGTLNATKNQSMIIRALEILGKGYELTILGSGALGEALVAQTKLIGLEDKILFKGKVKNVNDHLIESDCFVLSSQNEGFPNALLEAMAIGLPCISTNCRSGPLELLHDNQIARIPKGGFFKASYGMLINNDDYEGLARALEYLKLYPEERGRYGQLSLERAKEYNLKEIYSRFNQFING